MAKQLIVSFLANQEVVPVLSLGPVYGTGILWHIVLFPRAVSKGVTKALAVYVATWLILAGDRKWREANRASTKTGPSSRTRAHEVILYFSNKI